MNQKQYLFNFTGQLDKIDKSGASDDLFDYAWEMLLILQHAINNIDMSRAQIRELVNMIEDYENEESEGH